MVVQENAGIGPVSILNEKIAESGWYSVNATKITDGSEWLVDTGANVSCVGSADSHLIVGMIDAPDTKITTVVGTTLGRHAHLKTPVGVVRGLVVDGNVGRILCFGDFISKGGRLFVGGSTVRIAAPRGRMVDARMVDSMPIIDAETVRRSLAGRRGGSDRSSSLNDRSTEAGASVPSRGGTSVAEEIRVAREDGVDSVGSSASIAEPRVMMGQYHVPLPY